VAASDTRWMPTAALPIPFPCSPPYQPLPAPIVVSSRNPQSPPLLNNPFFPTGYLLIGNPFCFWTTVFFRLPGVYLVFLIWLAFYRSAAGVLSQTGALDLRLVPKRSLIEKEIFSPTKMTSTLCHSSTSQRLRS